MFRHLAAAVFWLPALGNSGQWEQLMLRARAAFQDGRYAEAGTLYASAVKASEAAAIRNEQFARLLYEFGAARRVEGRLVEAGELYHRALATLEATSSRNAVELSNLWQALAATYSDRQLYAKAENASRQALAIETSVPGVPVGPSGIAEVLRDYAVCLRKMGEKAQAKSFESRAAAIESTLPPGLDRDHVVDLAQLARGR